MRKPSRVVFYFRGLNTRGDDYLRIGPLRLSSMYSKIGKDLKRLGLDFYPVLNIKKGSIDEQVNGAAEYLRSLEVFKSCQSYHFLGHSTGGLIARSLLHRHPDLSKKCLSATSIATPHQGSPLAYLPRDIKEFYPRVYRLCQWGGYDFQKKTLLFENLTPSALQKFNKNFPNLESISYMSICGALPSPQMSWPIQWMQKYLPSNFQELNDGFVPLSSQIWGENLGQWNLDHLNQIGFFLQVLPRQRANKKKDYINMLNRWVHSLKERGLLK